jgi:hypothetical protein
MTTAHCVLAFTGNRQEVMAVLDQLGNITLSQLEMQNEKEGK